MFVVVNGQPYALPETHTLAGLLHLLAPPVPFAVARNTEVVPRGAYEECLIEPGDQIEIVHAAAGG